MHDLRSSPPHPGRYDRARRYGASIAFVMAALLLSTLLRPLIVQNPFLIFFAAVAFSAWYGGLGPGLLATAIAAALANAFFLSPPGPGDLADLDALRLLGFVAVAALISALSEARRRAEQTSFTQSEQLRVTLASIGDAVIATDMDGRVTFLNAVASDLTGWALDNARGQPIDEIFRIVNATTRLPVESPVAHVLREGVIAGLANHTILIARDGAECPIDDSGAPIRDARGRIVGVVLVFRDISAREEAERERAEALAREQAARERAAYLAEASRLLSISLDYEVTLRQVADLAVPALADWCVVDEVDAAGALQMVAIAHIDPAKARWAQELRELYPIDPDAPAGAPYVVRTGEPQLIPEIPDSLLEAVARSPEELRLLRMVGYRSLVVVPLRARGRILGALALVSAESGRRYGPDDLSFIQEVADRAAVAMDNARLYQAVQDELVQRQRAEAAQLASEEQMRLIADALPVLISYLDAGQRYRFNNRAYEEWFGEEREALYGKHIREVVGEAAYERLRPHLEAVLAGEQVSFETQSPYRAAGTRHIHATYVPDRAEDGAVRGAVILVEDISARKREEEGQQLLVAAGGLLAASLDEGATLDQVARLLVPAMGDYAIIYLTGDDGRVKRTALAHREPEQEALLLELERRYPLDLAQEVPVTEVIRTGRPLQGRVDADALLDQARDAEHRALLERIAARAFLAAPIRARGRTLGALLCVTAEADRQYTAGELRVIEEIAYRAGLAIDNASLYNDAHQAREVAEQAARRIARLQHVTAALSATMTPAQVIDLMVQEGLDAVGAEAGALFTLTDDGRTWEAVSFRGYPADLASRHVRIRAGVPSPLSEAHTTRRLVLVETPAELLERWPGLADAQGRSGDAAAAAVPLMLGDEVLGVLYAAFRAPRGFSADDAAFLEALGRQCAQALDRARLYEAELKARAEAEDAIRLRDLFLSVASHELKTPLTSLLLQTQLLQRRVGRSALLPEREQHALQLVADQAQRLDRMIVALLDISRLELGQLSLNAAPLDLCALARRVVAEIQPTTEAHVVTCTAPVGGLMVTGDELRLEQVLQNLVQNAIKYSPDGGPVEVIVTGDGAQVCVAVADRGIGLPEEALPRLFERFYRAPNADPRQISGMGIGLYVVKEIVRLHGGTVRAERQDGGGSRFVACFPQAPEAAPAAPREVVTQE